MQVRNLLPLLCWIALSVAQQVAPPKRVICYHTNWAIYRTPLARFTPENINPHLCTHLHYALANSNRQFAVGPSDPGPDLTNGGYKKFVALKKSNPELKVLIMLGGSDSPQQIKFDAIASDVSKMKRFVSGAINFARMHQFDGIDLDWQVEGHKDGHGMLLEMFAIETLKESQSSGKEKLLISTTMPGNVTKLNNDFDMPRIARAVDYVTALLYQFGTPENLTRHHAALFTSDPNSPDYADFLVQMYIASGADPAKLNFAVPTFGKTYTLRDPAVHGFGAPLKGVGFPGKLTGAAGTLSFTEICELVSMQGWTAHRPNADGSGPYAVKGDQWVAYDDEFMMQRKGAYIREKGIGGAAVWTIAQDDFRGFCTGIQYPLIEALKRGMSEDGQVSTTTPSPPTTPAYDNTVVFNCPTDGRFAKQDDCAGYYLCTNGVPEAKGCPNGTRFDADLQICSETAPECVKTPIPTLTSFDPTPAPRTPTRPIIEMLQPKLRTPNPDVVPVPRQPVVPAAQPTPDDTVVISAAEPTPQQPVTTPRKPETMLDMDMDVKSDGELQQLMRLIQQLGGVESVRNLLNALGQGQRTATASTAVPPMVATLVPPPQPVATPPSPIATQVAQPPANTQIITTKEGKTRIRVHVTVELEPY